MEKTKSISESEIEVKKNSPERSVKQKLIEHLRKQQVIKQKQHLLDDKRKRDLMIDQLSRTRGASPVRNELRNSAEFEVGGLKVVESRSSIMTQPIRPPASNANEAIRYSAERYESLRKRGQENTPPKIGSTQNQQINHMPPYQGRASGSQPLRLKGGSMSPRQSNLMSDVPYSTQNRPAGPN